MRRRQALSGIVGGLTLSSGCLGQVLSNNESGGLTIKFQGDYKSNERRAILVTIIEPSANSLFNGSTGDSITLTDETAIFYEKYELKPGESVHPKIFVGNPGRYKLDVWIEARGTMGTDIEIKEDGSLTNPHTIQITAKGISHSSD